MENFFVQSGLPGFQLKLMATVNVIAQYFTNLSDGALVIKRVSSEVKKDFNEGDYETNFVFKMVTASSNIFKPGCQIYDRYIYFC